MESIFKLGILLRVTDMASGALGKIGQSITTLGTKAEALAPTFEKFKSIGAPLAAAGAVMIAMLAGTVMSTVDTQKALGELASVGIKDMKALEVAGAEFSNNWAGTTKAQFIAAAYDIKSGISSLSDSGVAEFTRLAALTGKATKSSTAEMTSLFATAYGIYKDQYSALSDMQFGQMFSGGIAAAVQAFKTTGSGMAGSIENLGAAATVAKRPLEEQLAVLGMLQATMSGREAGTAYKAFFRDAPKAAKELGLNFYDAAGNMKSIDSIMGLLRGKFGDLNGMDSAVLQKAFSDESYRLIAQMYDKAGALTGNIKQMADAMKTGTVLTGQMASAMNQDIGAGMGILGQRIHNLAESLGKQLIPILAPLFAGLANGILVLQQFAEKHGNLTRIIMVSLAVFSGLLFILGGLAVVIGMIGLGFPAMVIGFGLVSGAIATATTAAWGFYVALFPITWIPAAVIAAVAALVWLYTKFEAVRTAIQFFNFFLGFLIGNLLKLATLKGWLNMFESGRSLISTLVDGIKSQAMRPVDAIKGIFAKVRNLLPFSDAKEGPLSQLTLSGSRIMSTLGTGILGAAPGLQKTMASALAGAALTANLAVTPAPQIPAVTVPQMEMAAAPAAARPAAANQQTEVNRSGSNGSRQVVIHIGNIALPGVANGADFIKQLQALVEGYDV
jgi:hypothetical protein